MVTTISWPLGDGGERADLPAVPFLVYRCGHPDGMSWTLEAEVVRKFARRGDPVWQCTVEDTLDVLALFHDRGESEVVLVPGGSWRSRVRGVPG